MFICRSSVSSLSLRAGSTQHASGGNVHTLASGLVHGSYSSRTLDYDIAVLRTSSAFSLGSTGIRAVSLLSAGSSPSTGALAYVSGWGTLSVSISDVSGCFIAHEFCDTKHK